MSDLISRQAAIDAADRADYTLLAIEDVKLVTDEVVKEIKQLPSAQPERSWIPVSERLPEEKGQYLCYIVNEHDNTLQYIMCCGFERHKSLFLPDYSWYPDDETASDNVIAWMPLPEPYKENEE